MRAIILLSLMSFAESQAVAACPDFDVTQVSPVSEVSILSRNFKSPLDDRFSLSPSHTKQKQKRIRAVAYRNGRKRYFGCVAFVANATGFSGIAGNGKGMADSLKREMGYQEVSCDNPPPGTVASWPGPRRPGHTGKWNGRCFQYDVGCTGPRPRGFGEPKCVAPTLVSQK